MTITGYPRRYIYILTRHYIYIYIYMKEKGIIMMMSFKEKWFWIYKATNVLPGT